MKSRIARDNAFHHVQRRWRRHFSSPPRSITPTRRRTLVTLTRKMLADVIARYHRLKGEKVFFLTGVDQHGQKVQQSAEKEGVPPEQFVAGVTEQFIALWDKLDVRYDAWAATTDPLHKKCVQGMLQRFSTRGKSTKTSRRVTTASARNNS